MVLSKVQTPGPGDAQLLMVKTGGVPELVGQ